MPKIAADWLCIWSWKWVCQPPSPVSGGLFKSKLKRIGTSTCALTCRSKLGLVWMSSLSRRVSWCVRYMKCPQAHERNAACAKNKRDPSEQFSPPLLHCTCALQVPPRRALATVHRMTSKPRSLAALQVSCQRRWQVKMTKNKKGERVSRRWMR